MTGLSERTVRITIIFFPRAYLKKRGEEAWSINHVANITIVDDYLNKREIKA